MPSDAEMLAWAQQRDAHERSVRAKRAVRYMADVRHPLKARRLDESAPWVYHRRKAFEPKPEMPRTAQCSKCGKNIDLDNYVRHHCF